MSARPNKATRRNVQVPQSRVVVQPTGLRGFWHRLRGTPTVNYWRFFDCHGEASAEARRIEKRLIKGARRKDTARDIVNLIRDKAIPLTYRVEFASLTPGVFWETKDADVLSQLARLIAEGELENEVIGAIVHRLWWHAKYGAPTGLVPLLQFVESDPRFPAAIREEVYGLLWAHSRALPEDERLPLRRWLLDPDHQIDLQPDTFIELLKQSTFQDGVSVAERDFVNQWAAPGHGHPSVDALVALDYFDVLGASIWESYLVAALWHFRHDPRIPDTVVNALHRMPVTVRSRCVREAIASPRLPIGIRLALVSGLDRLDAASLLGAARQPGLTTDERDMLSRVIYRYLTGSVDAKGMLFELVRQFARQDGPLWREIIFSDRIASRDPKVLYRLIMEPRTPDLVVLLAMQRIGALGGSAIADQELLTRVARAVVTAQLPPTARLEVLVGTPLGNSVRPYLAKISHLSEEERLAYLENFPSDGAAKNPAVLQALWDLAQHADHESLRTRAIQLLRSSLQQRPELRIVLHGLLRTPEDFANQTNLKEEEWLRLFPKILAHFPDIDRFFDLSGWSPADLIVAATDRERSPAYRAAALSSLRAVAKLTVNDLLRVVNVAQSEGDALPFETALWCLRVRKVLRAELRNDRASPLWNQIRNLIRFPDGALAEACLIRCDLPDPSPVGWRTWITTHLQDCPPAAVIPLLDLLGTDAAILNPSFRDARKSATLTHELVAAILQLCGLDSHRHERTVMVRDWLISRTRLGAGSERGVTPQEVLDGLRNVLVISALRALPKRQQQHLRSRRSVDLLAKLFPQLRGAVGSSSNLEDICLTMAARLGTVRGDQLQTVVQRTPAPLILAAHYLSVHPKGIPLLGQAIAAASDGDSTWRAFRYESKEGGEQLKFLSARDRQQWQENLRIADRQVVACDADVQVTTSIRACFREALSSGVFSPDVSGLIPRAADAVSVLTRYRDLQRELGRMIKGERGALTAADVEGFPGDLAPRLLQLVADASDRGAVLRATKQLRVASDLTRLMYLDSSALSRNDLAAEGESVTEGDGASPRRFVARLNQIEHLLKNPHARSASSATTEPSTFSPRLEETFRHVRSLLTKLDAGSAHASLVVEERDDFQAMIEIGHYPYGQGSCQDYASTSLMNESLLGYVVDAMTKAIVVRRTDTHASNGIFARAIVRVGEPLDGGPPVLVVERTYPQSADDTYGVLIADAARQFALKRGWRLACPNDFSSKMVSVRIPGSRNGTQYEDAAKYMIGRPPTGAPSGAYILGIPLSDGKAGSQPGAARA